jgi:hypothetical protein
MRAEIQCELIGTVMGWVSHKETNVTLTRHDVKSRKLKAAPTFGSYESAMSSRDLEEQDFILSNLTPSLAQNTPVARALGTGRFSILG